MTHLHNNPKLEDKRKQLRKEQTTHEGYLWSKLRNKKLNGYKFVRQHSVGPYILDFYCSQAKLAVELDGSQHLNEELIDYDKKRSEFLNNHHIKVLRFWNYKVRYDIENVLNKILDKLES